MRILIMVFKKKKKKLLSRMLNRETQPLLLLGESYLGKHNLSEFLQTIQLFLIYFSSHGLIYRGNIRSKEK